MLVPGLVRGEVGARSIFPEARPERRANWLSSGPRLLPIPRMGSYGIDSLEDEGQLFSPATPWHSVFASLEALRRRLAEEGDDQEEENWGPDARFALPDINKRSGTVLAQVPNKQLGRTSGGI